MYLTPFVSNVALTLANTEYSFAIPKNTRKLGLFSRSQATLKFNFAPGLILAGSPQYITVQAGQAGFWLDAMYLKGRTLYVSSDSAADVLEIIGMKDSSL